MCIAIYQPAGKTLPEETLAICFKNNPDGAGFAYINTDHQGVKRIKVYKSMDFDTFYKHYARASRISPESPFLIHFRIKTHGKKDIANCHPFLIDDTKVFIHNGIINGVSKDAEKSDTRMFNEEVLQKLPEGWMFSEGVDKLIEDFIFSSKIVVLDIDGNFRIYNENKGSWVDGCWMSNDSYKDRVVYTSSYSSGWWNGKQTGKGYTPPQNKQLPQTTTTKTTAPVVSGRRDPVQASATWAITAFSREECEFCNNIRAIKDMHPYEMDLGNLIIVCDDCREALEATGAVSKKDKTTITKYLVEANIKFAKEKKEAEESIGGEDYWNSYSQEYMM